MEDEFQVARLERDPVNLWLVRNDTFKTQLESEIPRSQPWTGCGVHRRMEAGETETVTR